MLQTLKGWFFWIPAELEMPKGLEWYMYLAPAIIGLQLGRYTTRFYINGVLTFPDHIALWGNVFWLVMYACLFFRLVRLIEREKRWSKAMQGLQAERCTLHGYYDSFEHPGGCPLCKCFEVMIQGAREIAEIPDEVLPTMDAAERELVMGMRAALKEYYETKK